MARLILVRHSKSDYPAGVADHDRPLNRRGRRDAPRVGRWLGGQVPTPGVTRVLVSTARRTESTWTLAAAELPDAWSQAELRREAAIYEAPAGVLAELVADTEDAVETLVLVGHNPGVHELCVRLARPGDAQERFPTSMTVVLEGKRWDGGDQSFTVTAWTVPRG